MTAPTVEEARQIAGQLRELTNGIQNKDLRDVSLALVDMQERAQTAEACIADAARQHGPADFQPDACVTCLVTLPCPTLIALQPLAAQPKEEPS